jgi:type VI secretion system protein ImpA
VAIDLDQRVAALDGEQPSGPDLIYDPQRQEIEAAFDRPVDATGGENDSPSDWRAAIRLIVEQGQRTRDLTLPIYLMRAAALAGDIELVADGAEWLARLTEERWDDVHPQLDEVGYAGRKAPCESLTRIGEFLGPLLRVPLLVHPRFGKYSGSDFIRFAADGANADGYGMFRASIEATNPDELRALLHRVAAIRAAIARTDSVFTEHAEGETGPNFKPTYESIDKMRRAIAVFLPGEAPATDELAQADGEAPTSVAPVPAIGGPVGAIASRNDAARTLDVLCAYFERHEPTSPVPLLLRRAKEWISLDFLSVLEDIVPNSLDEAKRILTSTRRQRESATDGSSQADQNIGILKSGSDDEW